MYSNKSVNIWAQLVIESCKRIMKEKEKLLHTFVHNKWLQAQILLIFDWQKINYFRVTVAHDVLYYQQHSIARFTKQVFMLTIMLRNYKVSSAFNLFLLLNKQIDSLLLQKWPTYPLVTFRLDRAQTANTNYGRRAWLQTPWWPHRRPCRRHGSSLVPGVPPSHSASWLNFSVGKQIIISTFHA